MCSAAAQIALVQWTESVGLALVERDFAAIKLRTPAGGCLQFDILQLFPFTSESKRMGIILRVSLSNTVEPPNKGNSE